jgi:hypothetical protein
MAMPYYGELRLSHLNDVFGGYRPISMSEYYRDASTRYTQGIPGIPLNTLTPLSMSTFRGKVKMPPPILSIGVEQLYGISHGTRISSWQAKRGTNPSIYVAGQGNYPQYFDMGNESPFVRIGGAGVQPSRTDGAYLSFGSQAFNIGTNGGFTMMAVIRPLTPSNYERFMDFGSGPGIDNIVVGRYFDGNTFTINYYNSSDGFGASIGTIASYRWQVIVVRFDKTNVTLFDDTTSQFANRLPLQNKYWTNTYIGKSNWGESFDAYANFDIREFHAYDYAMGDDSINQLRSAMSYKYY